MKRKNLIALVVSIALVLVLVLSGCAGGAGADKEYRALNPQGDFQPVETVSLAARLDTLNGKTIYIIQGEADPVIMPALAEQLPKDYPNTTWVYYNPVSSFGVTKPDDTTKAEADAVIRGIGW